MPILGRLGACGGRVAVPAVSPTDHKHGARREEDLRLAAELGEHADVGAAVEGGVALPPRLELPQHILPIIHVGERRASGARGGHEGGVGRYHHALLIRHPEVLAQLSPHSSVQRHCQLVIRRHRRQLAHCRRQVPAGCGKAEPRVSCQGGPVLAGEGGQLAEEGVDRLEGRARVEADGQDFVQAEKGGVGAPARDVVGGDL
mmetsp:Transcript_3387/g.11369  ORF Transcript_3387/g.11369 Transcript_3387/m.11369 type:complete len:202 (-) Transcript_3387:1518-2123(-)